MILCKPVLAASIAYRSLWIPCDTMSVSCSQTVCVCVKCGVFTWKTDRTDCRTHSSTESNPVNFHHLPHHSIARLSSFRSRVAPLSETAVVVLSVSYGLVHVGHSTTRPRTVDTPTHKDESDTAIGTPSLLPSLAHFVSSASSSQLNAAGPSVMSRQDMSEIEEVKDVLPAEVVPSEKDARALERVESAQSNVLEDLSKGKGISFNDLPIIEVSEEENKRVRRKIDMVRPRLLHLSTVQD